MVLATWNCYSIPYNVAFTTESSTIMEVFDALIDFCFLLDIIVQFRTAFINTATGDEISVPKLIAKHYLKGRFWIDFLATVPFDLLASGLISTGNP